MSKRTSRKQLRSQKLSEENERCRQIRASKRALKMGQRRSARQASVSKITVIRPNI